MGETCATCTHFIGSGDWGLCCDLKYDLCYSCTPKCNEYTIKDIMDIALFVKNSPDIDELSFRQLVDDNYEEKHHLEEYLRMGHKKLWWYIEQNDYNLYYAENQVSTRYRDFEKEVQV